MKCPLVCRHLDAYVDGELDPSSQIELEQHLAVCAPCQELAAFARGMKAQVRACLGGVRAPAGLRERIVASLEHLEPAEPAHGPIRFLPMRKRYAIPLAVAAAALMAMTYTMAPDGQARQAAAMPILEDVVRVHSAELPADVVGTQPQQVSSYFRNKVRFPVRPAEFERRDVRLVGARLSNVRDQHAAALYYDVGGHRVTVVVFEQPEVADQIEDGAHRARLMGRDLMYQQVNGYIVPMRRQDGLTYAFTGDLDRQSMLRLAATARVRY